MTDYNGRDFWSASVALTPAAQKHHSPVEVTSPYEGSPLDITIFVSCFNEEHSIHNTLDIIIEATGNLDMRYEIIVIDDGSKDGSVAAVKSYIESHPDSPIVFRSNMQNKGLAQNYLDAAFIGKGQYFCMIHGDNTEPMETMVDILRDVGDADIIIPYNISNMRKWSIYDVIADTANSILSVVTGHRLNDYNGLQIHLRYNVMRWHAGTSRQGFEALMLCQLLDLGFTCKQVPCRSVTVRHRGIKAATRNLFSAARTVIDILLWRLSNKVGW